LEKVVFCVHGGISPSLRFVEELDEMEKPRLALNGIFTDLLWSDPCQDVDGFVENPRGLGFCFGCDALRQFLDDNGMELLVRSHEMCMDGINPPFSEKICLTVFSNTDYCGHGNKGMILHVPTSLRIDISEKWNVPIINGEQRSKRRIILPVWLLDEIGNITNGKKEIDDSDSQDGDSQPEESVSEPAGGFSLKYDQEELVRRKETLA
jgi:protein phosphatase